MFLLICLVMQNRIIGGPACRVVRSLMPLEDFLIDCWVLEDAPYGDITTAPIPRRNVRAKIVAKSQGVVAGLWLVERICRRYGLDVHKSVNDGDEIKVGDIIAEIVWDSHTVLILERLLLNLLIYLSGVATATRRFAEKIRRINPKIRIATTRKTIPGLRYSSKEAAKLGGGDTHRFGLSDCYLIKDNHIVLAGGISEAVRLARSSSSFTKLIEVEVRSLREAIEAAEAGANIIMFDNMPPDEIARAIEELKRRGLRDRLILEASGGITLENVEDYARLDIDVISTSAITLRPDLVDMSLKIVDIEKP